MIGSRLLAILGVMIPVSMADEIRDLVRRFEGDQTSNRIEWVDRVASAGDEDPGLVIKAILSPEAGGELQASAPLILRRMFERRALGAGEPELGAVFQVYLETDRERVAKVHPVIAEVRENSPAAAAGLRKGDVVVSWDGKNLEGPESAIELKRLIRRAGEGAEVKVGVRRFKLEQAPHLSGSGDEAVLTVTLGPARAKPVRKERRGQFAGWLNRMRHEHGLPDHLVTPQS